MDKSLSIVVKVVDQATKQLDKINGDLSNFSKRNEKALQGMAIAGGVALGAITAGVKKSIDASSNLSESINALTVVFGEGSEELLAFGENSAKAVGLSQRAFNQLATPVGAMLQNMGRSAKEASEETINLTKRAADMASVFNVDVADAMGAIQAGIRGEADPLERFGVSLNDTSIKAYALAKGLIESEREMTAQEKTTARLGLLYEQTAKLQGDFANTSDGLANQQRILSAEFENTIAKIGGQFQPILEGIQAKLLPIVEKISERIEKNPELTEEIIIVAGALAILVTGIGLFGIAVPGILAGIGAIGTAIAFLAANPIVLIIAAIVGLTILIIENWDQIKAFTIETRNKISTFLTERWDGLGENTQTGIRLVLAVITGGFSEMVIFTIKHWDDIKAIISGAWEAIKGFFIKYKDDLIDISRVLLAGITLGFSEFIIWLVNNWEQVWATIKNTASTVLGWIGSFIKTTLAAIGWVWNNGWDKIKQKFNQSIDFIKSLFDGETWKKWAINAITMFATGLLSGDGMVRSAVSSIAGTIKSFLGFGSPTDEGPASNSDTWIPNFIGMISKGLEEGAVEVGYATKRVAEAIARELSPEELQAIEDSMNDLKGKVVSIMGEMGQEINSQESSVLGLVKEYKGLRDELEKIGETAEKELGSMNQKIEEARGKLSSIQSGGKDDVAIRAVKIQEQLLKIEKDLEKARGGKEIDREKENELLATQKKLQEELNLAKTYVSTEEIAKAQAEVNKTETQKIVERIAQKTLEAQKDIDNLIELKKQKEIEYMEEKKRISDLMIEKQTQIENEYQLYATLIARKTELDNKYFAAFGERMQQQQAEMMRTMTMLDNVSGGGGFNGQRAMGGPVTSNTPYLVGENGPEMFIPSSSGSITPNSSIGGQVTINMGGVSVSNQADENRLVEKMKQMLIRDTQLYNYGIS